MPAGRSEAEPACSQTDLQQAAAEAARAFPPMSGEQAALVGRALREQQR
ncbi:MAG: hypothetical protein ACRDJX_03380 [Solirubrobacteraceae bacterium]